MARSYHNRRLGPTRSTAARPHTTAMRALRLLLGGLACAAALLSGCDVKIKRPPAAEPPPEWLAGLGPAPGTKVRYFPDATAVLKFCREQLGPASEFQNKRYAACFVPATRVEALIDPQATPDQAAWAETEAHEDGHSWDVIHPSGGKGWAVVPGGRGEALLNEAARIGLTNARRNAMEAPPPGLMGSSARQFAGGQ